jgi:hypothetical protein
MADSNLTPEQAAKAQELNIRIAERVHDENAAYLARMSEQIMKDAWATLRTLVLINGGAAIAILTFVGGIASKPDHNLAQLVGVAKGLRWFAWGVIAAALASGISYLTNFFYGSSGNSMTRDWQHPYLLMTPWAKAYFLSAKALHVVALLLAAASLALFAVGVTIVGHAITHIVPARL